VGVGSPVKLKIPYIVYRCDRCHGAGSCILTREYDPLGSRALMVPSRCPLGRHDTNFYIVDHVQEEAGGPD
jgi:hypothetical protein